MHNPNGAIETYKPQDNRRDVRGFGVLISEAILSEDGGLYLFITIFILVVIGFLIPLGGEIMFVITLLITHFLMHPEKRLYNFPWRVPIHAKLFEGSKNKQLLDQLNKGNVIKYKPKALYGEGVTYYGVCRRTGLPVYSTNSDDRTHIMCLGTTGSGKTEFLLALVNNQLIQNSGFIYIDAKGDPSLQQHISRLALRYGRQDDILTMNFITSGLNLSNAQPSKITNSFNLMANTSDGMLIETLSNLLDSGNGGSDMWLGRALAFLSALTKVLVHLRDHGHLLLSPATYDQHMQLPILEELVFEHNNRYGESFSKVSASLESYLVSIPAYNTSPKARKKQGEKTVEQHGYIVMQLTRAIGELTYNYGHIFGVRQGDIDIFDCVLNRRILTIPLPALERSKSSIEMLGKLIIGSIKQMMAGSLGNRLEGVVREILDSRPTNASNAYKVILDEVGYMLSQGLSLSIIPAQGRSLNFSAVFAAQDFTDLKRADPNEAEAIWGNTTVKAIGRIVTGDNGDTMTKVNGITGEIYQARASNAELKSGDLFDTYKQSTSTTYQKERVLPYSDLASQENGEFTLLISKKLDGGKKADVKVIMIQAFYVYSPPVKYLRMNDLCPNFSIPKDRLPNLKNRKLKIIEKLINETNEQKEIEKSRELGQEVVIKSSSLRQNGLARNIGLLKNDPLYTQEPIERLKVFLGINYINYVAQNENASADADQNSFVGNLSKLSNVVDGKARFIDEKQTDIQDTIEISKAVSQSNDFKSELENRVIENSKPLEFGSNSTVSIVPTEATTIQSISIFKLMEYTPESDARLKNHGIQNGIQADDEHSLSALMPSQLFNDFDADSPVAIAKIKPVTAKDDVKAKAQQVKNIMGFSVDPKKVNTKKPVDSLSVSVDKIANIDEDKRKAILEVVLSLSERVKNHFKFK